MKFSASVITLIVFTILGVQAAQAETIGTNGAWTAFKTTEGNAPVCYVGAQPQSDEGDYNKRGDIYMLVTHRPALKEMDVVSIEAGYEYQKDSDAKVVIGDSIFMLFTNKGNAWARDSETDKKLVAAMKRGTIMVVTATSWRGTNTKDTYSLTGFTAAYNAARKACGL